MLRPMTRSCAALVAAALLVLVPATAAQAAAPSTYKNCTELNKKFAHGIGKADAVDKVARGGKPVTNFRRDTPGYNRVMKYNRGLDRDRDGIACEQR